MRNSPTFFFLIGALLFCAGAHGQQASPDSVPEGVITVRRPPVPAAFVVKVAYDYSGSWEKRRWWEPRHVAARKDYKAWLSDPFPPAPVSVAHEEGDSISPVSDSARMQEFRAKSDRPEIFKWGEYASAIPHMFSWTDTMRLDSARFQYVVDKEGRAVCTPAPWNKTDSSSRKLEREAWPVMRTLWLWYPAQRVSNRDGKTKHCPCTVTVTVYAFELNAEKPPPVIVNSGKKKG